MQTLFRRPSDYHRAAQLVQARTTRDRIRTNTTQCHTRGGRRRRQRRQLKAGAARSAPGTPPGGPVPARTSLQKPQLGSAAPRARKGFPQSSALGAARRLCRPRGFPLSLRFAASPG
jgi:hypothetical protein